MATSQVTSLQSINPATREIIAQVPCMGQAEVEAAVQNAWRAYESWRLTDYKHRAGLMLKLKQLLTQEAQDIAELITCEVGKPLSESFLAEITASLDACAWFADNTERLLQDQSVALSNPILINKRSQVVFEPLGVVGIIAPWNYPFAIPFISLVMALMTGNTAVFKPSEKSPLTGVKIGELFCRAGFPQGVVNVVTGDRDTGALLTQSQLSKLIFTGSVEGGQKVMAQAAQQLMPVTLELGGKDAAIVLPDAPVDWTARGLVWGAFTNCGQACASIERVYIVKGPHTDELIKKIIVHSQALKLGSGLDPQTQVGPLIDQMQLDKVAAQVEQAKARGATIACGGKVREDLGGFFYEPTVLLNVDQSMVVMQEETFGPVLPIMVVDSTELAVKQANDSQFGLCASIWTKDTAQAKSLARSLQVGSVLINDGLFSFACPQVPWGGLKKSGLGRTHSYFGLLDLVNIKHICADSAGGLHRQWWYPYNKGRLQLAQSAVQLLHGSSVPAKIRALRNLVISFLQKS